MFGKKTSRQSASSDSLAAERLATELACRRMADKIGDLEHAILREHPENMTINVYAERRIEFLSLLRDIREHELTIANLIRAIGEAGHESSYP